jgi:hypothetical protein
MDSLLTQQIVLATVGGLVMSILNLLEIQHLPTDRRPDLKDPLYWIAFIAWPLLGGLVGYLHTDPNAPLGRVVSFQLGLSAPLILKTAANVIPQAARRPLPKDA